MEPVGDKGAVQSSARAVRETQVEREPTLAQQISRVQRVVGVMSGKGGVGKSLVTALLALALREAGHAVGVLDADITGPSIPRILGLQSRPEAIELGLLPVTTRPTG
jgi:Mrp family chromosome partitioning ATPase